MNSDYSHDAWAKKYHSSHRNIEDRAATWQRPTKQREASSPNVSGRGAGGAAAFPCCTSETRTGQSTRRTQELLWAQHLDLCWRWSQNARFIFLQLTWLWERRKAGFPSRRKAAKTTNPGKSPHSKKLLDVYAVSASPSAEALIPPWRNGGEQHTTVGLLVFLSRWWLCFCVPNEEPDLPNVSNLFPKSSCYWT